MAWRLFKGPRRITIFFQGKLVDRSSREIIEEQSSNDKNTLDEVETLDTVEVFSVVKVDLQ